MKDQVALLIAVAALVACALLVHRVNVLEDSSAGVPAATATTTASAAAVPVEVAHTMSRIQSYAEKLWWAGKGNDLDLVKFYRHEIKEEMEEIANAGIVDNGVPISENMKVYGIRAIDALKEQLNTDSLHGFEDHYGTLVLTCNSCHATSGHPELRMRVPTENRFTNQEFTPNH